MDPPRNGAITGRGGGPLNKLAKSGSAVLLRPGGGSTELSLPGKFWSASCAYLASLDLAIMGVSMLLLKDRETGGNGAAGSSRGGDRVFLPLIRAVPAAAAGAPATSNHGCHEFLSPGTAYLISS